MRKTPTGLAAMAVTRRELQSLKGILSSLKSYLGQIDRKEVSESERTVNS